MCRPTSEPQDRVIEDEMLGRLGDAEARARQPDRAAHVTRVRSCCKPGLREDLLG